MVTDDREISDQNCGSQGYKSLVSFFDDPLPSKRGIMLVGGWVRPPCLYRIGKSEKFGQKVWLWPMGAAALSEAVLVCGDNWEAASLGS